MSSQESLNRRAFIAVGSTSLALAGAVDAKESNSESRDSDLAIHGGPKAVKASVPKLRRWGDKEQRRLTSMIEQDSLFYWKGPQTTQLIENFRKLCPSKYVMSCSSGTAALHIAVAALGIQPGDEVVTSPITDIGTVIGVIYQQGVPVFADLDPATYNLDPDDVARKITPKTKAIIAVHLAGNPCDLARLKELADRFGLVLIEDCAQAWGAHYRGQPVGTVGHIGCFSLQQSKQVTCGDGGIVASNDERFGPKLQRFGDKGLDRLGTGGLFESFATNYRMSEPQAAVAAAQLERVEEIASKRAKLGNRLSEHLRGIQGVEPHRIHPEDRCTFWFYMFRLHLDHFRCDRTEFVKALTAEGVPASAGYIPVPLYGNPVFQQHGFFAGHWPIRDYGITNMDYTKVSCSTAESILKTSVRISIQESMSEAYVESIAEAVRKVARHYRV